MVRGLSKHQGASLFDCCVFIARLMSLSCYPSAKTRIRLGKSYQINESCCSITRCVLLRIVYRFIVVSMHFRCPELQIENATYGSEFVAAKNATEQIIDINSKAYMFGDNKSVVTSSTVPHSLLSIRHNILSYHRVREAIAAKILVFHWCDSSQNKSDILSKHWEFYKVCHIIRDLFDFQGKITLIQ